MRKYFENLKKANTAQYNTGQSQQLKFTADPKVSNTERSFAGNNFVFAGLFLPSMRILIFLKIIFVLLQHSPTFFINTLKG